MNLRASTVGELAAKVLARGGNGELTRVFPSSVYVKAGGEFMVMLWGSPRSPLTLNLLGERPQGFAPGMSCRLDSDGISVDGFRVQARGAHVFRSSLRRRRSLSFPTPATLASSVAILRSMYEVSASGPTLPSDRAFRDFVDSVVSPIASGNRRAVNDVGSFLGLVGRGLGFTPAGDDFLGGFAAVYNLAARAHRWKRISFTANMLSQTTPESAAILNYAAKGYVDELSERFIIRSTDGRTGSFQGELFALARRGHTSGIDMSLGVLLAEASLKEASEGGAALRRCLDALWNP